MSYAIAIYEMVHLQELGLYNLRDVVRGAVYITKNPMLCFTQTIDWIRIAPSGKESHDIYVSIRIIRIMKIQYIFNIIRIIVP